MSRTVSREEAVRVVGRGSADFRVLSAMRNDRGTMYVVQVPLTTIRDGLFGPIDNAISGGGKPTKFGNSLFYALHELPGIEPGIDRRLRDGVTVFVSAQVTEEPPNGFWHQSHGLPASVCYVIQQQIMHHRTGFTRLLEYIRRAI